MTAYIAFAALLWVYAVSSLAVIDLLSATIRVIVRGICNAFEMWSLR